MYIAAAPEVEEYFDYSYVSLGNLFEGTKLFKIKCRNLYRVKYFGSFFPRILLLIYIYNMFSNFKVCLIL